MHPTLAACRDGQVSPQIALARLVLAGDLPEQAVLHALAGEGAALAHVAALAAAGRERLERLAGIAARGLDPEGPDMLAATAALFDRLAGEAPEAAVAFYSLGDPALLATATAELAGVVRAWAPVAGRDLLDFGCGIGRVALALAGEARSVVGLDLAPGMVAQARQRAGGAGNVRFEVGGRDLSALADASVDVMIAADSFPYVVRADAEDALMAEAARVVRPGGALLVFNWSYRGDLAADAADAVRLGATHGFRVVRSGERPFAIWDAAGFHLVRA